MDRVAMATSVSIAHTQTHTNEQKWNKPQKISIDCLEWMNVDPGGKH